MELVRRARWMFAPSCRIVEFSFAGEKYECEEMKKCISDDGSRITYFSTVARTFLPPSSLLPLFTNTFPRFNAPPCTPSPLLFSEEACTCHGKTLLSTRIKQVIAHGTKLFPRSWLRYYAPWTFRKTALRIDAMPFRVYAHVLPVGNTRNS